MDAPRGSLLRKITLDLMIAALVPLTIASWFAGRKSRDELESLSLQQMQLLAKVTASKLDQLIEDTSRTGQILAFDDDIRALAVAFNAADAAIDEPLRTVATLRDVENRGEKDEARVAAEKSIRTIARDVLKNVGESQLASGVKHRLETSINSNPDYASVFIVGRRGVGIASTNDRNIGQDLTFRDYVRQGLSGRAYHSELLVGKTTRDPGVYFSTPIFEHNNSTTQPTTQPGQGVVVGAVVIKLRGERIWQMVDEVRSPSRRLFAMLADNDGIVIAHPQREKLYRSFDLLGPDDIARINPEVRYGLATIDTIDLPELMPAARSNAETGSQRFGVAPEAHEKARSAWVAGYARMKQQPWKVFAVQPAAQFGEVASGLIKQLGLIAGGVAVAAIGLAVWRARGIVKPVLAVSAAAKQLAGGDFSARADKLSNDEVGQLADAFNTMVPQLRDAVGLQQSMRVATEVQQSLLPRNAPKVPGLDIYGTSKYCDATGGDYFDYVDVASTPEGDLLVVVGDVMGHGIGSAMLMASARGALRASLLANENLADALRRVNEILVHGESGLFMTLLLMRVDPGTGKVQWTSAGHDAAMIYSSSDGTIRELDGAEIPLGLMSGTDYQVYDASGLRKGDVMIVGTDGIWETKNAAGDEYGKDRMMQILKSNHAQPAAEIGSLLENDVAYFRDKAPIHDDVTYVIIRFV
jgi:serine phosphatase RsbU (regulator of sigma subunit)